MKPLKYILSGALILFSVSATSAQEVKVLNLVVDPDKTGAAFIQVGNGEWLDFDDDGYVEEYSSHRKVRKHHHPKKYNEGYRDDHKYRDSHKYRDHYRHRHADQNSYRQHRHKYYDDHYHRPKYISRQNARRILNRHGYYHIAFIHGRLPTYKARACKNGRHFHVWVNKWGKVTKARNVGYCSRYSRIRDFWLGRRHTGY